jgi:hypothetical protein
MFAEIVSSGFLMAYPSLQRGDYARLILLFAAKMKRSKVTPRSIVKQQNRCQAIISQSFSLTLT